MSETARALGHDGEITWQGKPLQVSRVIFDIEGYFELWLENQLSAALERARAVNTPAVYKERLAVANGQLAAGDLHWEGEIAQRAAWNGRGFKELAFYCISQKQPGWTRTQHDELFEDQAKVTELVRIIHRLGDPHPNGQSPAVEAGRPSPEPSGSPSSPLTAA